MPHEGISKNTSGTDYWVDGVKAGSFDPRDPGLLSGLSIFETLRTYDLHIFRLAKHHERLRASAEAIGIEPPSFEHFASVLEARKAKNVSLRYLLTVGGQEVIYRTPLDLSGVGRTIRLGAITVLESDSLPANVKHGSRAEWVLAATQQDVDEVLLCSPDNEILEANRSAFFCIVNGTIWLPPSDTKRLSSVTLGALFDAIKTLHIPVKKAPIFLSDDFQEAYVVSTLKGLSPVVAIQGRLVNSPGPIGRQLIEAFEKLIKQEAQRSR